MSRVAVRVGILTLAALSVACGPERRDVGDRPADEARADSSVAYFYVRVKPGSDPEVVARDHGLEATDVIRHPVGAFYAALDVRKADSLRKDPRVESLALDIHGGEDSAPDWRRIRGPPGSPKPAAEARDTTMGSQE